MRKLQGSILIPQKGGLGARHLSSVMENKGMPLKLYFLNKVPAHSLYNEHELREIKTAVDHDYWVGLSVSAIGLKRAEQLIRMLKCTKKRVIAGGVQAIATPGAFLEMGADAVCRQEGELWLPRAIRMLEKGISIPKDFETETPKHDSLPAPDYGFAKGTHFILEQGGIRQMKSAEDEFAAIDNFSAHSARYPLWLFTNRRCRFGCSYCINARLKRFDRTHDGPPGTLNTGKVLDQVKDIIAANPIIDFVVFFDDDFLLRFLSGKKVRRKELGLFCDFWKTHIARPFFIYFTPATFNEEILNALIDAGASQLNFGYQSASREALRYYRRAQASAEKVKRITGFTSRAVEEGRIRPPDIDFLINSPFETADDMRSMIEMMLKLDPPFDAQMHNLRLFPGYPLTETFSRMKEGLDPLPGHKTILDRELQDHTPHSEWLWQNIDDDRAYYTILQMLMTGSCTNEMLGVLKRQDMDFWMNLGPKERVTRIDELRKLFKSNPRTRYYDELSKE